MDIYTATEQAYKNGVRDFAEYLKKNSFLCDPDNRFSFYAIDVDELDDLVNAFLRGDNL